MKFLLVIAGVIAGSSATAQLQIAAGMQMGYPIKIQQAYYHSVSIGIGIEAAYKFPQSNLYPYIKAGVAALDLPLNTKAGNSFTVSTTANRYSIGLYRAITDDEEHKSYFIAGCGIGIDIISADRQNVMIGGNTSGLLLNGGDDAIMYPNVSAVLQYRSYFHYGGKWFYSARLELACLLQANEKNNYHIDPLLFDNEAQFSKVFFWPAITVQIGRIF